MINAVTQMWTKDYGKAEKEWLTSSPIMEEITWFEELLDFN